MVLSARALAALLCLLLTAVPMVGVRACTAYSYGWLHLPVPVRRGVAREPVRATYGAVREAVRITLPMPVHLRYAYLAPYLARTRGVPGQVAAARPGPLGRPDPARRYTRLGRMYRPGYGRTPPPAPRRKAKRPARLKGERGRAFKHQLAARDGGRCHYCRRGVEDPTTLTLDHYVPADWARRYGWSGVHEPYNLVLACRPCNRAKGTRLPWPLVWVLLARFGAPGDLSAAA